MTSTVSEMEREVMIGKRLAHSPRSARDDGIFALKASSWSCSSHGNDLCIFRSRKICTMYCTILVSLGCIGLSV